MSFTMAKANYARVPVAEHVNLTIDKVEFKPTVNPVQIITTYKAPNGATLLEYTKTDSEVGMNIFRNKFDLVTNGAYADTTEFETKDIVKAMIGKTLDCKTVEEEYNGKKYVRLKYVYGLADTPTDPVADEEVIPF